MSHFHTVLEFVVIGFGMLVIALGWLYRNARVRAAKVYNYTKDTRVCSAVTTFTKDKVTTAESKARDYLAKRGK